MSLKRRLRRKQLQTMGEPEARTVPPGHAEVTMLLSEQDVEIIQRQAQSLGMRPEQVVSGALALLDRVKLEAPLGSVLQALKST